MGKGDKKSRRGKIVIGSFGVRRPQRNAKNIIPVKKADIPVKKVVEEQLEIPVLFPEIPLVVKHDETAAETKKPARKPTAKKTPEKSETERSKTQSIKTKKESS